MKRGFFILFTLLALVSLVRAQEINTFQIYDNAITHTNIKANITSLDGKITKENVCYTVTYAAQWTGKLKTVVVYNGDLTQMQNFLKSILQFADNNKDNIGASTKIDNRKVSMAKQWGIKCITIKIGSQKINTNHKSISKALEKLDNWIKENNHL